MPKKTQVKAKDTKLTFAMWRDAQFGPRSDPQFKRLTDEQLQMQISAGETARIELESREHWDAMARAALLAWAVQGKDKVVP